jgi:hypothetical protein
MPTFSSGSIGLHLPGYQSLQVSYYLHFFVKSVPVFTTGSLDQFLPSLQVQWASAWLKCGEQVSACLYFRTGSSVPACCSAMLAIISGFVGQCLPLV